MKLKALLLGSAAAMIAVSGARAADAVVAEPEPMEYVKVCDMYGAGFFYMPGTETCMAFSGYVRVDYTYNDNDNARDTDEYSYRARFNIDVRNETDYGTLRSQLRFQGDGNGGGDAVVGVDRALISLGGFRAGYSDSYQTTHHGYGHPGIEKYDGPYGYDQAMFFDYTYAANGFSATAGIQDSIGTAAVNAEYYAGIGYTGSMFGVAASYLYEDATREGAWKVSANIRPVDGFTIAGWYFADSGVTRALDANVAAGADWSWGVGVNYQATDTLSVAAAYSDVDTNDGSAWTVGAIWNAAPGLSIRPNVIFRENDTQSYAIRVYRTF